MSQDDRAGDHIHGQVTGDVSGQVGIGKHIAQQSHVGSAALTPDERQELDRLLGELRARISAEAPEEERQAALERVDEIGEELASGDPDPLTLAYVGRWFVKKLPDLASGVVSLVVHPIVGKLVGAAGEELAERMRGRMGEG